MREPTRCGRWAASILAGIAVQAGAAEPATGAKTMPEAEPDAPVAITLRLDRATVLYHLQGRDLDHPVGDGITLLGTTVPARLDAHGGLTLDTARTGRFSAVHGIVTLAVPNPTGKGVVRRELGLSRAADGHWQYRDLTTLSMQIGPDRLTVLDADGDGTFNTPGADALAWAGCDYAFPLPAASERWCSPHGEFTGLTFGPNGETPHLQGRAVTTAVPEALAVLQGVNALRAALGLTPRPNDDQLSHALQRHCHYLAGTHVLAHPETPGTPNYSAEGNDAGMNSILSQGCPPAGIALSMVCTLYHRFDVVRPNTEGFGVGFEGGFGGIDGRRHLGGPAVWPVLVPAPDQQDVPLHFVPEAPDPLGGQRSAGFPITAFFGEDQLHLVSATLQAESKGQLVDVPCQSYDADHGGVVGFNRFFHLVALIPRAPLAPGTVYHVALEVDRGGPHWTRAWTFTTTGGRARH